MLNLHSLNVHDDFFARGGHSLHAVQLLAGVRTEFGRELSPAELFLAPTVATQATLLRESKGAARTVLVPLNARGERPPLFLVHPVGGHVVCYVELARHLGRDQPVHAFQAVPETQHIETFEALATRYVEEMRRVQPSGPYFIGGWSLGGVVAFEMARQLEAAGQAVSGLVLIDSLPGSTLPQPQGNREEWLFRLLVDDMQGWAGASLGLDPADLAAMTDGSWAEPLLAALKQQGAMPDGFGPDDLRALVAVYRRNVLAFVDYVPGTYPGRVLLATASDSERALAADGGDVLQIWSSVAQGGVEHLSLDTDHYGIVQGEPVQRLAEWLKEYLGEPALAGARNDGEAAGHD